MSELRAARLPDLVEVASWISSARACHQWAGSRVGFPIDLQRLPAEIEFASAQSWCMPRERSLAGFGQIVPKPEGRQHLARLIIAPKHRGMGLGRLLTEELVGLAQAKSPASLSLNVFPDNREAVSLYRSLGFRRAERPACDVSSASHFMVLSR